MGKLEAMMAIVHGWHVASWIVDRCKIYSPGYPGFLGFKDGAYIIEIRVITVGHIEKSTETIFDHGNDLSKRVADTETEINRIIIRRMYGQLKDHGVSQCETIAIVWKRNIHLFVIINISIS